MCLERCAKAAAFASRCGAAGCARGSTSVRCTLLQQHTACVQHLTRLLMRPNAGGGGGGGGGRLRGRGRGQGEGQNGERGPGLLRCVTAFLFHLQLGAFFLQLFGRALTDEIRVIGRGSAGRGREQRKALIKKGRGLGVGGHRAQPLVVLCGG